MSDQKRFIVKIYDRQNEVEYEFDGENFSHDSEAGVSYSKNITELQPNNQFRHCFKLWTGFKSWDDFESITKGKK